MLSVYIFVSSTIICIRTQHDVPLSTGFLMFFCKIVFYHSFGTLCRPTAVCTLTCSLPFVVAWQSLSARSLCCALTLPHVGHQIFVDIAFLSSMNARWNLIFDFLPCAIDSTCAHTWLAFGPRNECKRRSC